MIIVEESKDILSGQFSPSERSSLISLPKKLPLSPRHQQLRKEARYVMKKIKLKKTLQQEVFDRNIKLKKL
jgi:hypothetical protein